MDPDEVPNASVSLLLLLPLPDSLLAVSLLENFKWLLGLFSVPFVKDEVEVFRLRDLKT